MSSQDLLNPAHLSKIDNYALIARTATEGFLTGLHRSISHGRGTEFFQYRSYSPGEDLKYLDWKVYARRNQLQTKTYEEETNTTCYLVLDVSASMDFAGQRAACSKIRYACMVAACLAYLAARQGDSIGFLAYNENIVEWIGPRSGKGQLTSIVQALSRLEPAGRANHEKAWDTLTRSLPGRGIVVFLSDMLEAEYTLPPLLRFGQSRKYDCLAVQILDPDEMDLPYDYAARFEGCEGGDPVATYPEAIRDRYMDSMNHFLNDLNRGMADTSSDYFRLLTNDHLGLALAHYLHQREKRKR